MQQMINRRNGAIPRPFDEHRMILSEAKFEDERLHNFNLDIRWAWGHRCGLKRQP